MDDAAARMGRQMARRSAVLLYSLFSLSISFPTPFAEVSLAFLLQ